jgi:hypothetical protein
VERPVFVKPLGPNAEPGNRPQHGRSSLTSPASPGTFWPTHLFPQSSKHRPPSKPDIGTKTRSRHHETHHFNLLRHVRNHITQHVRQNGPRSLLPSAGNLGAPRRCSGVPTDCAPGRATTKTAIPREGPRSYVPSSILALVSQSSFGCRLANVFRDRLLSPPERRNIRQGG